MSAPRPPEQIRRAAERNTIVSLTPAETLGIFAELDEARAAVKRRLERRDLDEYMLRQELAAARARIVELETAFEAESSGGAR